MKWLWAEWAQWLKCWGLSRVGTGFGLLSWCHRLLVKDQVILHRKYRNPVMTLILADSFDGAVFWSFCFRIMMVCLSCFCCCISPPTGIRHPSVTAVATHLPVLSLPLNYSLHLMSFNKTKYVKDMLTSNMTAMQLECCY